MKSIQNLTNFPREVSLLADDILEFHAARLLLLMLVCGKKGKIDGLTKMAKLDFFVRYPQFFETVCRKEGIDVKSSREAVESNMVRYHYGPWDHRYYHVLAYLKARNLIEYNKDKTKIIISLTQFGKEQAEELKKSRAFKSIIYQMQQVSDILGKKSGTQLKKMVYENFDQEVAKLDLGEIIK